MFAPKPISPFKTLTTLLSFLNIDIGNERHFFNVRGTGFSRNAGAASFSLSYGKNIFIGTQRDAFYKKTFVFKPTIGLCYSLWGFPFGDGNTNNLNYIGTLDNSGKAISLLGYQAQPTYTLSWGSRSNRRTEVVNAKTLDIYYLQHDWDFIPRINIGNNPYKRGFHWQIEVGYLLPAIENEGLALMQDKVERLNKGHIIDIRNPDIKARLDGQPIHSKPYHMRGLLINLGVSFMLAEKY